MPCDKPIEDGGVSVARDNICFTSQTLDVHTTILEC
jgi:hypothetical protein